MPTHITVFATPSLTGYTLTDGNGKELQERYVYNTRKDALAAARKLWPANSVWHGRNVRNGWRIEVDDANKTD
jgi:hypothetical protein